MGDVSKAKGKTLLTLHDLLNEVHYIYNNPLIYNSKEAYMDGLLRSMVIKHKFYIISLTIKEGVDDVDGERLYLFDKIKDLDRLFVRLVSNFIVV